VQATLAPKKALEELPEVVPSKVVQALLEEQLQGFEALPAVDPLKAVQALLEGA
jgi:hypothetical protein